MSVSEKFTDQPGIELTWWTLLYVYGSFLLYLSLQKFVLD